MGGVSWQCAAMDGSIGSSRHGMKGHDRRDGGDLSMKPPWRIFFITDWKVPSEGTDVLYVGFKLESGVSSAWFRPDTDPGASTLRRLDVAGEKVTERTELPGVCVCMRPAADSQRTGVFGADMLTVSCDWMACSGLGRDAPGNGRTGACCMGVAGESMPRPMLPSVDLPRLLMPAGRMEETDVERETALDWNGDPLLSLLSEKLHSCTPAKSGRREEGGRGAFSKAAGLHAHDHAWPLC